MKVQGVQAQRIEAKAVQMMDEMEQLIRDGVDENDDVADGWLKDWDDVEYRIMKSGEYRGVVLLQRDYEVRNLYHNGLDVEIDTARMMISVLDGETDEMVAFRYVEDEETLNALKAIDQLWEAEYYGE